jgi:CheY-like chemotaxis protein
MYDVGSPELNPDLQCEVPMTADMAFECLIVSRDPGVVCVMNKALENFSISTNVCFTNTKAADQLAANGADLIIVDWEETTEELLRNLQHAQGRQKPTVVAVSSGDRPLPGAHLVVRKPVTGEACVQSIKVAYFRMLRDHRRFARYAVMTSVTAQDQNGRTLPITIMDIGDGGVGLMTKELLAIGDVLSFRVLLPGADRSVYIEARILWTRQYGAVGCEFLRIPPVDLSVLHEWLKLKCRVKQPLVDL